MKAVTVLAGLLLGACAGFLLLLLNPLSLVGALDPLPPGSAPAREYRPRDARGGVDGLADLLGIGAQPTAIALSDPALKYVRIAIVTLPATHGLPPALGVKVSTVSPQNSLWRARLGTLDHWNVFAPGEGSLFASGYSNFWSPARDAVFAAIRGGGTEDMAAEYPVSALPPAGHAAGVVGASGRYAGFTGEIRESLLPTESGAGWMLAVKSTPPPLAGQ